MIDVGATLFVLPALIAFSVTAPLGPPGTRIADYLGRLSYPLYLLHYPFVPIFSHVARSQGYSGAALAGLCVVEILCMTAAAALALHLYDEPVRRLQSRVAPGGKAPARIWRPLSPSLRTPPAASPADADPAWIRPARHSPARPAARRPAPAAAKSAPGWPGEP